MNTSREKIIYALIAGFVLLAFGEVYIIMMIASRPVEMNTSHYSRPSSTGTAPTGTTSTTYAESPITSGIVPHTTSGIVNSIGNKSLTIAASGSTGATTTETITLSDSNTQIIRQGALKNPETQAADMKAYQNQYNALMQDPQKNADAIAQLAAPSPYQMTPITLSDLKIGQLLFIVGEPQSDGTFAATEVLAQ
ncbi:MAG TPA: hypothetical protein VMU13_02000 [Candidatus Paceibacterota bacterium]|nr:hypothetical protein [Candidatus Paceibacterota bacterium]